MRTTLSERITFRYLTPVFNYNSAINFECSGSYKDVTYSISLKRYAMKKDRFNPIFKYANEIAIEELRDNIGDTNLYIPSYTEVFLIVDVQQPFTVETERSVSTLTSYHIFEQILNALRLHTTTRLLHERYYIFRSPPFIELKQPSCYKSETMNQELIIKHGEERANYVGINLNTVPLMWGVMKNGEADLLTHEHDLCKKTFQILLNKEWDYTRTSDKVIKLALDYYRISFNLERVEQAFLILIVSFEALFKKNQTEVNSKPADRIGKLLSTVQKGKKKISKDFFGTGKCLSKIGNSIRHGDPTLDETLVEKEYPNLYRYITAAIIELLKIPDEILGENYYEELDEYLEERYSKLEPR